jgi:hypothetical protein
MMRKRSKISLLLRLIQSTTSYDNTIALALVNTLLYTFFFLILDFGSYNPRCSSRLYLRRLRFCFLNEFEDLLRIEDELPFNRYALSFLTFPTYP